MSRDMINRDGMRVHPLLATAVVMGMLSLQGWMLSEISGLKERVAGLTAMIQLHINGDKHLAQK